MVKIIYKYTILHDDIKLTIDEFQGLSNTFCYNF